MRAILAIVCAVATLPAAARVLTFEQVVAEVRAAHAVSSDALDAARLLAEPHRSRVPSVHAETAAMSARDSDLLAQNVFRYNAVSAFIAADYPLMDGGVRDAQARTARVDAEAFRQRMAAADEELFRQTVEAAAALYDAQERRRMLGAGLQRAVAMRERSSHLLDRREISNVTAAQWQDQAVAAESLLVDLDLRRLDAETRVKQLMGDASPDTLEITIALDNASANSPRVAQPLPASRAALLSERKRLAVEEAAAARRPQLMMSMFGGVTSFGQIDRGGGRRQYGIYGVRFNLALPMFDAATTRRVAEARLDAAEAEGQRTAAAGVDTREESLLRLNIAAAQRRIELLQRAVGIARDREQSTMRLVAAGLRSEASAAEATTERSKRESDLLAARVDLWKYRQLLQRQDGAGVTRMASSPSADAVAQR